MNKKKSKRKEPKFANKLSFKEFLDIAEIIIVDDARTFDINKWEAEQKRELDELLSNSSFDDITDESKEK